MSNALAAAALAGELGLAVADIAAGLSAAEARSRWRMEVTERPDGVTVINDAYNANPEAMRAALSTRWPIMARGRRAFAVLGHMTELGRRTCPRTSSSAGTRPARAWPGLIVVGEAAAPILAGAKTDPTWRGELLGVSDTSAAIEAMRDRLRPGDVVLVKASRSAGLRSRVALALAGEKEPAR